MSLFIYLGVAEGEQMTKKLKYFGFAVGVVVLFFIVTLKFVEDDSWNAWNLPLSGKIVVLDAGHGGIDGGANINGVMEKDIALNVTLKLRDYLQEQGALVILTREDDSDVANENTKGIRNRKQEDLRNRVELINYIRSGFIFVYSFERISFLEFERRTNLLYDAF